MISDPDMKILSLDIDVLMTLLKSFKTYMQVVIFPKAMDIKVTQFRVALMDVKIVGHFRTYLATFKFVFSYSFYQLKTNS